MSEKRKNDKVKNQPSSASTRTALLLLGAMLVIGALAAVSLVIIKPAPSVPDSMIEEVTPITIEAESVGSEAYGVSGCNYMWHNQDDAALSTELESALDTAGIAYESATINAYGEQEVCQSEDGSYYDGNFLIMDYSPQVTIVGAQSDAERGQQILDLVPVAHSVLADATKGYLNVVFVEADGEETLWRVQLADVEAAIAEDASPEDLYAMGH